MPDEGLTGFAALDVVIRIFDRFTAAMSALGTLGILLVMLLISADVFGRFVLGRPIAGVPEIVAMSILSIVFLQLANTLMRGKITRADGFLELLKARAPRIGLIVDALMHFVGAALLGVLVNAFYPLLLRAWGRNETVGAVGHFLAPVWPSYLIVLVGALALCIAFTLRGIALSCHAAKAGMVAR